LVLDDDFTEVDGGFAIVQFCSEPPRVVDIVHNYNVLSGLDISREWRQKFAFPPTLRCGNSSAWMLPFDELAIAGHASANELKYFDVRTFGTRNKCEISTWFTVLICDAWV
jgi:hypothetical protein